MNSRERVRAALAHKETDRIPIDLGGMTSSGISALAYCELKQYLGLDQSSPTVFDVPQMLALVEAPLRERLGVDVVPLPHVQAGWGAAWNVRNDLGYSPRRIEDWPELLMPSGMKTEYDEAGSEYILGSDGRRIAVRPAGGYYYDPMPGDPHDLPEAEDFNLPDSLSDQELAFYRRTARDLYHNTECAVLGAPLGYGLFILNVGGLDNWLCALLEQPEAVGRILDKAVECNIGVLELFNQAAGKYVEAVIFSDDLGTQNSEWISPDVFREVFAPRYSRIFGWIHENTDLKVFLHCCGSIPNLIEPLIECGVDILNPVQTGAAGMDPAWLKDNFGDRLVFWGGGVDTQQKLLFSPTGELVADVRRRLEIFSPGGGYVFNPIHNIQPGTDPEKIVACFDTAREFVI
jgi:uroporphyrinogen decarboxylase